jgi:hypothetical protein
MSSFERWWAIERTKPWARTWSLTRAREHFGVYKGLRNRWHPIQDEIELNEVEQEPPVEEMEIDVTEEELLADDIISNVGETTELLGGGSSVGYGAAGGAIAAGAGAATTTGSIAGSAALGVGVTLGSAAIGSAVFGSGNSDKKNKDGPPITFPHHSYIGPGNDAYSGAPEYDLDDHIAHVHDIAYHHAKTQEDILDADKKAIHDFASDAFENYNPHSAIGAIGLGVKHGVEKLIGVKYPSNLPLQKDVSDGIIHFAGKEKG